MKKRTYGMRLAIERLHCGELSWVAFERATRSEWTALAISLMRAHALPCCVEVADVRQELLVWAWKFMGEWRVDGGQPIHRYVVIGACNRARRWLAGQRNAYRRSLGAASRLHASLEVMSAGEDGEAGMWDGLVLGRLLRQEADQEESVSRAEATRVALDRADLGTSKERHCVVQFVEAGGHVGDAVNALYADKRASRFCRFGSREDVRRTMFRAVRQVADAVSASG